MIVYFLKNASMKCRRGCRFSLRPDFCWVGTARLGHGFNFQITSIIMNSGNAGGDHDRLILIL